MGGGGDGAGAAGGATPQEGHGVQGDAARGGGWRQKAPRPGALHRGEQHK